MAQGQKKLTPDYFFYSNIKLSIQILRNYVNDFKQIFLILTFVFILFRSKIKIKYECIKSDKNYIFSTNLLF